MRRPKSWLSLLQPPLLKGLQNNKNSTFSIFSLTSCISTLLPPPSPLLNVAKSLTKATTPRPSPPTRQKNKKKYHYPPPESPRNYYSQNIHPHTQSNFRWTEIWAESATPGPGANETETLIRRVFRRVAIVWGVRWLGRQLENARNKKAQVNSDSC